MKATVINYNMNKKTNHPDRLVIQPDSVSDKKEAVKLLGKKVALTLGETKLAGKIIAVHGRNGAVSVRFSKGVPGQVVGKECQIA